MEYEVKDGVPYLELAGFEFNLLNFVYKLSNDGPAIIIGYGISRFYRYEDGTLTEIEGEDRTIYIDQKKRLIKIEGDKFAERDIFNLIPPPAEIKEAINLKFREGWIDYKSRLEKVGFDDDQVYNPAPFILFKLRLEYVPGDQFFSWLFRNTKITDEERETLCKLVSES